MLGRPSGEVVEKVPVAAAQTKGIPTCSRARRKEASHASDDRACPFSWSGSARLCGIAKMTEDEVNQYRGLLEKTEEEVGFGPVSAVDAGDASVMPKDPRDVVKVHYTGRTREGKVFDTSKFANRSVSSRR